MNIVKATPEFEAWPGLHTTIVPEDLKLKHRLMAESQFSFFRATFYRWCRFGRTFPATWIGRRACWLSAICTWKILALGATVTGGWYGA
jgi:hypothetical protein